MVIFGCSLSRDEGEWPTETATDLGIRAMMFIFRCFILIHALCVGTCMFLQLLFLYHVICLCLVLPLMEEIKYQLKVVDENVDKCELPLLVRLYSKNSKKMHLFTYKTNYFYKFIYNASCYGCKSILQLSFIQYNK